MAEKKKRTQAEKMASTKSTKKKGSSSTVSKKGTASKNTQPSFLQQLPIRFLSSGIFIVLFILFLIIFLKPEGTIPGLIEDLVLGLIGRVGFIVSIPALLYLFFIHAFSGKRPVIMRSVCIGAFVLACGAVAHMAQNYTTTSEGILVLAELYSGGISYATGGVLCGGLAMLIRWLCGNILTYIILILTCIFTLLGAMQITIPSIIRAIQNRPRADWED